MKTPKKFYVTTPIYYVNDEPHIGHAYTTVIADILARYHRLFGDDVFFLTGTDEHGQKVAEAALNLNRTPQEHCDIMVQRYHSVWEKLNISHDDFIRTTEKRHIDHVQTILQQIREKGEIYEAEYEGWYCVPEERFWTEKDLEGGNCPSCGREVRRLREKNYFFRMSKYQDWLINYIKQHPRFILPEAKRNEILGFLSQPLNDLCISRPKERLPWGVSIPFDENFVTYVWFDALLNYYTAPKSKNARWWPATVHLIGKDILTTHCVYWPTMLKAAELELPETIFGHGWWLYQDKKMSKSLGNVVKPLAMADKYGVDSFRFFVAREMSLGMDASFSEEAFVHRYNSELANDLGNLYSRILKLLHTFCDGKIPQPRDSMGSWETISEKAVNHLHEKVRLFVEELRLNAALDEIMAFVREINRAVELAAPWKTGKTDPQNTCGFLFLALEALANAACLFHPVMPEKMSEILKDLGVVRADIPIVENILKLKIGHSVPEKAALFPRLKLENIEPKKTEKTTMESELISFDEFKKILLKVARIIRAERAPNSDKLLILEVELGGEKSQLVAGIAGHYQPEELIGKLIVMVANLKPARIRGIQSDGMLLAAQNGEYLTLIVPDHEVNPGSKIS